MVRERTIGEKLAPLVGIAFMVLAVIGGVDPVIVVIGGAGCVAFAIMTQLMWNARLEQDRARGEELLAAARAEFQHERAAVDSGSVFGTDTAPRKGHDDCTTFACAFIDCVDCTTHSCNACGGALYEHGASWRDRGGTAA